MVIFHTTSLQSAPVVTAPDGSLLHVLAATGRGSMAHFALGPGEVSAAVRHRTVDELWFVTAGAGRLWRGGPDDSGHVVERIVDLAPGVSVSLPVGTSFQFRAADGEPLRIVGVTMPPWPGDDEAEPVEGPWTPSVPAAPGRR